MPATTSTSSWTSKSFIPVDYDDLATLCKLARKARNGEVAFDWVFTKGELLRLREAVLEWGTHVVGRYAVFDARVLRSINIALGEENSAYVIKEPKAGQGIPYAVGCYREGESFRLQGRATFDLVFGYGHFDSRISPAVYARLGPDLPTKLAGFVALLGWDMAKMREPRYVPVVHALYGLRTDAVVQAEPALGEPLTLDLNFHGPFTAAGDGGLPSLFASDLASKFGVYLWTVPINGRDRVWYVGQTRRGFGERTAEHIRDMLSGKYSIPVLADLLNGEHKLEWSGGPTSGLWPATLPDFLARSQELTPKIVAFVRQLHFYVAEIAGPPRLYDRAEGLIGRYIKDHTDIGVAQTVVRGIRLPVRISGEAALKVRITGATQVAGLPAELDDL